MMGLVVDILEVASYGLQADGILDYEQCVSLLALIFLMIVLLSFIFGGIYEDRNTPIAGNKPPGIVFPVWGVGGHAVGH